MSTCVKIVVVIHKFKDFETKIDGKMHILRHKGHDIIIHIYTGNLDTLSRRVDCNQGRG